MPALTITKTYDTGQTLTEAMLDNIKDDVETFINVTKLDQDNIQDGGVSSDKLAANSVVATKLNSDVVDDSTLQLSTNLRIKDAGVTRAKLAAVGQQVSSSCGSHTVNTSVEDVTNLSVSITTTGRPVMLMIMPAANSSCSFSVANTAGATGTLTITLVRGVTTIAGFTLSVGSGTAAVSKSIPSNAFFLDVPAANTYTYKIQATRTGDSTSGSISNAKLVAYEL